MSKETQNPVRMVKCKKLGKVLPGLESPPLPGELGQRIYENISAQAWEMFKNHFIMVTNEYRLDLTHSSTDQIFLDEIERFLFQDTAKPPEGYTPE